MRVSCTLIALLAPLLLQAQQRAGIVVDKETGAPLPYVHIGVEGKNAGTISRDDGRFSLDITRLAFTDSISFSMVGYTTLRIALKDLKDEPVRLAPAVYTLKPVSVSGNEIAELKTLGRPKPTKVTIGHSGGSEWGTGSEWGLLIRNTDQLWLQKVAFHSRFNTLDSVLFRIHIYRVEADMPGESILAHDIFVKSRARDKWIIKDITDQNIVVDSDFVVTMEIVRLWYAKSGDNELFFTYGQDPLLLTTFSRESSQAPWQANQMPPLAMYVVGRKISE